MARVFVIVLDSLGVGELPDAAAFGDTGAHTLDHIAAGMGAGFAIPRLLELGLGTVPGVTTLATPAKPLASTGRLAESSPGKDTSTGHWEMMGCPLTQAFPVFPDGFPPEIIDPFVERCRLPGVLENGPASGTEVIERLGAEHIRTGKPIVYTSADSVFQIAAHSKHYGLERLLDHCRIAREILTPYGVGRVIARPFIDAQPDDEHQFVRTYDRRDFSLLPPLPTSLDRLKAAGHEVIGVGKIEDIFAGQGLTRAIHTEGNRDGMRRTIEVAKELEAGFVFVNLVDFDMLFGHRRDVTGYGRALEEFDTDLVALERELREGDLVILTADHGNDPAHPIGTDHTREYVPVLAWRHGHPGHADLGTRTSFADLGATVEAAFGLEPPVGTSFLEAVTESGTFPSLSRDPASLRDR
jgi:phosphopentomutase